MNKKNIRTSFIIVIAVSIWMLLGLFAPTKNESVTYVPQKQTVLTSYSVAKDYQLPIYSKIESEAFSKVDLRSQTSERVRKMHHQNGDFVQEGNIICELDSGQRQANYKKAEIEYASQKELNKKGLSSESSLVTSETAFESAKIELDRTKIRAPFGGFIEDVAKEGQLLQNGQKCGTLISLSPLKIVGNISELLVSKIKLGQEAKVKFVEGSEFMSNITFISSTADPQTKTFRVETELSNLENSIKDGLTGEMLIYTDPVKAHFVPTSAFILADDGDVALAQVVNEGTVEIEVVDVLRDTIDGAWVTGLSDVARIIIGGQGFVKEGEEVNFQDK